MSSLTDALKQLGQPLLDELEAIYTDVHRHPELSMQATRTAKIAADFVQALGYEVTREVGVTGVAAGTWPSAATVGAGRPVPGAVVFTAAAICLM